MLGKVLGNPVFVPKPPPKGFPPPSKLPLLEKPGFKLGKPPPPVPKEPGFPPSVFVPNGFEPKFEPKLFGNCAREDVAKSDRSKIVVNAIVESLFVQW